MMSNLSQYTKYLTSIYRDDLYIRKYKVIKNDDGTEDTVIDFDSIASGYKCKLSIMRPDEEDAKNIDLDSEGIKYKVFCQTDIVIQKGDEIEVHKIIDGNIAETVTGIAGTPVKFDISQEVIIYKKGVA